MDCESRRFQLFTSKISVIDVQSAYSTTRTEDGARLPALTALQLDYNGVLSADTRKSVSMSAFARTVRSDRPRLSRRHQRAVIGRSSRTAMERKSLDISAIARSRSLRDFCVFRCALLCSVVPIATGATRILLIKSRLNFQWLRYDPGGREFESLRARQQIK